MTIHAEKETPREKNFQCDICRKKYFSKNVLVQHLKQHVERGGSVRTQQDKFVAEHFDLKCDFCDTIFNSLHDARDHYKAKHNEDKGYIKCCDIKLRIHSAIRDHVAFHLNPESFK